MDFVTHARPVTGHGLTPCVHSPHQAGPIRPLATGEEQIDSLCQRHTGQLADLPE